MGFFSWRCAISDKSIPHDYDQLIHLVLPNDKVISGYYDGYGCINGVSVMEEVAKVLGLKDGPYGRRGVYDPKTKKEYFYQKDFANYESVLPDYGKTVNQLVADKTLKDIKGNFDICMQNVKIVTDYYFHNPPNSLKFITEDKKRRPRFSSLPVSKDCEHQGYFYPEDFDDYAHGYYD